MVEPALEKRILRFLYTGTELPIYFPGCWLAHKYFENDKLVAVNRVFLNKEPNLELLDLIKKAYNDNYYTRFETIAFALSKCLLVGLPKTKEMVYKIATDICTTPEELMMFNKFARYLKTGNGRGWCRHIQTWYLKKDPMELAKEVTRVVARHGRSHKTLLRKSHLKVPASDHARDAIVKYIIHGLKRAKSLVTNKQETKEVFDYIEKVYDVRHCESESNAAKLARENNFTLDHVPGHLLTSQEVWDAILPQFTIEQLLYNIQRIHNMGFMTDESTTTAAVVSLLHNQDLIKKSKVTPLAVHIVTNNYLKKSRPLKHQKAKVVAEKELRRRTRQVFDVKSNTWVWTSTKRHPKEAKSWGIDQPPNTAVISALNHLLAQSWLLPTPPTNKRYLITMDMRSHMFKGRRFCKKYVIPKKGRQRALTKSSPGGGGGGGEGDAEPTEKKKSRKHEHAECFYNKHVQPGHAAFIVALQILKREKHVKLAVFTEEGIKIVTVEKKCTSFKDCENMFSKVELGRVQLDAPIAWATAKKEKFDVFINMVDRTTRYMELDKSNRGGRGPGGRFGPPPTDERVDHCPVRALERYRTECGVPDSKLIVMSLASHRVATSTENHEGILDVVGIDEHVPKVLDAFALGLFK